MENRGGDIDLFWEAKLYRGAWADGSQISGDGLELGGLGGLGVIRWTKTMKSIDQSEKVSGRTEYGRLEKY